MRRNDESALWHLPALTGLAVWGAVQVGRAGTLTIAFWIALLVYAALVWSAYLRIRIAFWLALVVPALWLTFSSGDLIPDLATYSVTRNPWILIDISLVPLPCLISILLVVYWQRRSRSLDT